MRYAYCNLGAQSKGSTALVRWNGAAADVFLLDPVNFTKYREAQLPVRYSGGGHYRHSPAQITIPEEGRWYVIADLLGYSSFAQATVELSERADEPAPGAMAMAER